jgi:glycosyltransferase involved in cell wall biosynthesis
MKNKNISFIIPAFNCAETIKESINSILDGNFDKGDEIIIVDDKSTDNTLDILNKISSNNSGIKIIKHEINLGGASARNTAVKNTKNDLIFCLDSDNILKKGSINKLKHFLISSEGDVASFGKLKYFNKNIKDITHKWKFNNKQIKLKDLFCSSIVPPSSGNYLFTKESWKKAGGYPEFAGALDTWGFGFRQLATGAKMFVLKKSYYFHRHGHDSYWIRESRNGRISEIASSIIKPYEKLIDKNVISFIENNTNDWFDKKDSFFNTTCNNKGKLILPLKTKLKIKMLKTRRIIPYFIKKPIKKVYLYINFIRDFLNFKKYSEVKSRFNIKWKNRYPQLFDKTKGTDFDTHYTYHPAWAARKIVEIKPSKHVDISSILGFSAMLSAFVPVEFYDYRPANIKLDNLTSKKADLTSLPFSDNSIESLSCMHTVEHIGLGRYGDPIDPDGDIKAMKELSRVLAINGNFFFVTPIGKPTIQFNAHRIYSYEQIISYFPDLILKEFSMVPDNGPEEGIIKNASKELADSQKYACGLFWFTKN